MSDVNSLLVSVFGVNILPKDKLYFFKNIVFLIYQVYSLCGFGGQIIFRLYKILFRLVLYVQHHDILFKMTDSLVV